jgi:RsiW-degrading membrane proteinase PrsW (M82 family)
MVKKIINCFDKDPVNLGRQRELDIAKGIFIIFMSFSHCIEILGWFFDPNSSVGASWHDFDMVIKSLVLVVISCMGIGFAVLENAYYLLNYPNFTMLSAIIRAFGSGLMHGMCTLLVGMGISFVKKKSKMFWAGTFGFLSTAVVYHGIYNILIQSKYSIIGALLPISTYIPFLIWRFKTKRKKSLENADLKT